VEFTTDPGERRRLEELCSKQGSEEYMSLVRDHQVSFIDFITSFPSCVPSLSLLIENLPRLLPRPYSFSSSCLANPTDFSFVYTVVDSPRPGLATSWLKTLQPGDQASIYPRLSSGFHAPVEPAANYLMICAGSGIGPFLGFLEDRRARGQRSGTVWMFFGCRHNDKDYIHKEKLAEFLDEGYLSKLTVAFSRDDNNGGVRYVQDAIEVNAEDVSKLIMEGDAKIYVCGDAKNMGRGVNEALGRILTREGSEGAEVIKSLVAAQRYKQDLWT